MSLWIIINQSPITNNEDEDRYLIRIGQLASVTAQMHMNVIPDTKININIKLRPLKRGKHLVVISNCAAELSIDPITNATLAKGIKAVIQGGIDIIFIRWVLYHSMHSYL